MRFNQRMAAKVTNLQDTFLNLCRKAAVPVTAYLMNGVPIKGKIMGFDAFVVLFEADGKQALVFKHAISTIIPAKSVDTRAAAESAAEAS